VEFYPSITPKLLNAALDFASLHVPIPHEQKALIMHARKSLLFSNTGTWSKTANDRLFDVTMGSHDGAEVCELVGSYLLHLIKQNLTSSIGLYRADGLGVIKSSPKQTESMKKRICSLFRDQDLKITINANRKAVNYLDVHLDLRSGKFMPFNKPNNVPSYVHIKSNHPPCILRNIPKSINNRLSTISSDDSTFRESAPIYQAAIEKSGYNHKLNYEQPIAANYIRIKRRRAITWFNPPYSRNVKTNIGKAFLNIIDEEFPRNHILHKLFNRNSVKVSYSCMRNINDIIKAHNSSLNPNDLNRIPTGTDACNCRKKDDCPLDGGCRIRSVVYQATVNTTDNQPPQSYVGLTDNEFKTRFYNHTSSFKHSSKRNATELSKFIWSLKDKNIEYRIK